MRNGLVSMVGYQRKKLSSTLVLLGTILGLTGCFQQTAKPLAPVQEEVIPVDWETLADTYGTPMPFPVLEKLKSKAQMAYQDGDYQATHLLLDQMFRVDSQRPDVMALKGWVYCQQAEYDEAQLWLQRARGYLHAEDKYDKLLKQAEVGCQ